MNPNLNSELLEKLLNVSRKIAENRQLDPLLEYAMRVSLDLFGAQHGYLMLINEDGSLNFRVRQSILGGMLGEPDKQISHTIFEQVIRQREPLIIADAVFDPDYHESESVQLTKPRSVMVVPLIASGDVLGAIYIENRSKKGVFKEDDLVPLQYLAAQTAISIENAILNEQLESRVVARTEELNETIALLEDEIRERKKIEAALHQLAITDSLTELHNRRHFFELAEMLFNEARESQFTVSAVMIDLDYFKQVNDQHGHRVGDQVLRAIAQELARSVRGDDVLGRYGGEEFTILMPGVTDEKAFQAGERLRKRVAKMKIETDQGVVSVTISMGVAELTDDLETVDRLIDRADQALYFSKDSGRNQITLWSPKMARGE